VVRQYKRHGRKIAVRVENTGSTSAKAVKGGGHELSGSLTTTRNPSRRGLSTRLATPHSHTNSRPDPHEQQLDLGLLLTPCTQTTPHSPRTAPWRPPWASNLRPPKPLAPSPKSHTIFFRRTWDAATFFSTWVCYTKETDTQTDGTLSCPVHSQEQGPQEPLCSPQQMVHQRVDLPPIR